MISGANRLCIWRGWLSSFTFQINVMSLTVAGLIRVSLRCHDVRCGSPPSVSQFARRPVCACGPVSNAAARQIAPTTPKTSRCMTISSNAYLSHIT